VKGAGTSVLTANASIPVADVTGAAPLASPTFTGTVTTEIINTGAVSATSVNTGTITATSINTPIYASTPQALTDGSTINWNPALGLNASVTLGGNRTLSFTSTPIAGAYGTLVVSQDATGSRTITLPTTANKVLGSTSTTSIALSTAANAKDILNFYYDGTNCYWNIGQGYGTAASSSSTNLTTSVTGTLPVANGGTGATTLTGIIKGTGTSSLTAAVAGTDYQAPLNLTTNGTGVATLSGTTLNIPTPSAGSTHTIGESYGGGIVFYTWDGGAHGLIGANTELNSGQAMTWGGGSSTYVGTTSYYGVLGGKLNTQRILNVIPVPTYGNGDPQTGQRCAAFWAATYLNAGVVVSGVTTIPQFSDWYLPNAYELTLFSTKSEYFPNCNFATHDHWSSSERSDYAYLAYALGANSNTYVYQTNKTSTNYVVAIRSF
jgi:hypothetical protein